MAPLSPLRSLRRRLTIWYAATFGIIITLLGVGLFLAIGHQLSRQLDDSLRDATREIVRAARIREMEATGASGRVMDAVEELHIPDRTLYLFEDMTGAPGESPEHADPPDWRRCAHRAGQEGASSICGAGSATGPAPPPARRTFHPQQWTTSGRHRHRQRCGTSKIVMRRWPPFFAAGAALAAVVLLVAAGGWSLARKSTEPAERSMEHMRRFMADAAHELRTPLAVLRSRAEFAIQQPHDAASYLTELRGISAESERLCRIVEDLLILARADAGERPLEREPLFLDDITLDAADAARVVAKQKGVSLDITEFEEAPVEGDPLLLRQLVMILLDNAVKFTPAAGQVRVSVRNDGNRSIVAVEDSGVGISS